MLQDFKRELGDLNPNYYGMVDQIICSRAEKWAGAFWSTFSAFIHRLRGYHGLGEESYYHTPGKLMDLRQPRRSGPGWTRDWRAPSLPQVGTITVLDCVMAGAPASASRTPL